VARPEAGRAFVADFAIPAPDRDSGSLRMLNLLILFQEQGLSVTFASMGLEARQPYLSELQKRGIKCLYRPYEDSVEEHLRSRGNAYDLVILSRLETAAELMDAARRWCPKARIVFDTVDLHHQRVAREAMVRNDPKIERIAERIKKQELALIEKADTTLVVSEAERALLATEAPAADVRIVSNIHQIYRNRRPFQSRSDILFVGGFAHPPNTDAVRFFCQDVFPLVLARLPQIQFFVIGSDPPANVASLASANIHILGYVPDVEPHLQSCRLSVAPLRFGAGVKGKINLSLAHGLPVVATSIAAEGMFLKDGESVLIADDAHAFADAVVRLYQSEVLWNRLVLAGLAVMEQHFGFEAARRAVFDLLVS
jgi:glycosyltransferase involved in cell wall biosynthesis